MIRVFNHYFHAWTLRRIMFDFGFALLLLVGVVAVQAGSLNLMLPMAGPQVVSLAAGLFVINTASGLYQLSSNRSLVESCVRAAFALLLALVFAHQMFRVIPIEFADREAIRLSAMLVVSVVIVRRVFVGQWLGRSKMGSRVLIFGAGPAAQSVGATLKGVDPHAKVVGYLPGPNEVQSAVPESDRLTGYASLSETARKLEVDEIVVALTERRAGSMPLRELLDCKLAGVRVFDVTTYFERILGQIRIDYVNAGWLIFGDGFNQGVYRTTVKRVFDIVCSLILILLASPVMLLATLAIVLESKGPVFYRQERVGLNSRTFKVNKFRSMRTDAEKDGKPVWAAAQDSRVTRVGHIILLFGMGRSGTTSLWSSGLTCCSFDEDIERANSQSIESEL
ncbi:sugar transferase [Ideonella sp. A 288]|uniref:sugar transferase n=1 Tax=Ideonella sp. A 288 TaxID=1962181 RepID=UPI000B4BB55D|nr:sugar transferase [Ideonella sp. A 288]